MANLSSLASFLLINDDCKCSERCFTLASHSPNFKAKAFYSLLRTAYSPSIRSGATLSLAKFCSLTNVINLPSVSLTASFTICSLTLSFSLFLHSPICHNVFVYISLSLLSNWFVAVCNDCSIIVNCFELLLLNSPICDCNNENLSFS